MKKKNRAPSALRVVGSLMVLLCLGLTSLGCSDDDDKYYPPPPAPTNPAVTGFTSSHVLLLEGDTATITVSSTNGVSASVDNGVGTVPINGPFTITPAVDTTYTLTITGAGGTTPATSTLTQDVDRKPVITSALVVTPSSGVAGSGGTVEYVFYANDPEGNSLIITPIQSGSLTVPLTKVVAGDKYTYSFTKPAAIGNVIVAFNVDDGNGNGHIINTGTRTYDSTAVPSPPPTINLINTDGQPILTDVSNQPAWANGTWVTDGYTAQMTSVTNASVHRLNGSDMRHTLPRQPAAGANNVEYTFNNGAVAVNKSATYTDVTTQTFRGMVCYEKAGFMGRFLEYSLTYGGGTWILSTPTVTKSDNTLDVVDFSPGADSNRFWILASNGIQVHVLYHNVVTNTTESDVRISQITLPLIGGLGYSLVSLRDGTACAVLWKPGGLGDRALNVTVVRDTGLADPDIVLDTAGKEVLSSDGVTNIKAFFYKENAGVGAGISQDMGVFAAGTAGVNQAIVLVRLASRTYDRTTNGTITVIPEKLVVSNDVKNKTVRLSVVGNNGAGGIVHQQALMNPALVLPVVDPEGSLIASGSPVNFVKAGYLANGNMVMLLSMLGSASYRAFDLTGGANRGYSIVGYTLIDAVLHQGQAWVAIAADDGTNTVVRFIASPDDLDIGGAANTWTDTAPLAGKTNAITSTPTHVLVETRDGAGNNSLIAIDLPGAIEILVNEPATDAPTAMGEAAMTSSRHLVRDCR